MTFVVAEPARTVVHFKNNRKLVFVGIAIYCLSAGA